MLDEQKGWSKSMTRQEILAKAKPILFNTEMVKAISDNRKTATRRVIKPQPTATNFNWIVEKHARFETNDFFEYVKLPYLVGSYLYVREIFYKHDCAGNECIMSDYSDCNGCLHTDYGYCYAYRASHEDDINISVKWRSSIHMPKEASRIFLRVTDIRVERLQDITEEQAKAEGVITNDAVKVSSYRYWFEQLWDSILPKNKNKFKCPEYSWNTNPWVWVIEFERIEIDE